jgi:hypothetical protein
MKKIAFQTLREVDFVPKIISLKWHHKVWQTNEWRSVSKFIISLKLPQESILECL